MTGSGLADCFLLFFQPIQHRKILARFIKTLPNRTLKHTKTSQHLLQLDALLRSRDPLSHLVPRIQGTSMLRGTSHIISTRTTPPKLECHPCLLWAEHVYNNVGRSAHQYVSNTDVVCQAWVIQGCHFLLLLLPCTHHHLRFLPLPLLQWYFIPLHHHPSCLFPTLRCRRANHRVLQPAVCLPRPRLFLILLLPHNLNQHLLGPFHPGPVLLATLLALHSAARPCLLHILRLIRHLIQCHILPLKRQVTWQSHPTVRIYVADTLDIPDTPAGLAALQLPPNPLQRSQRKPVLQCASSSVWQSALRNAAVLT